MSSVKLRKQSKGRLDLAWTSLGVVQDTSKVEQGARVVRVGGALERASHPRVFWDIVRSLPNITIPRLALVSPNYPFLKVYSAAGETPLYSTRLGPKRIFVEKRIAVLRGVHIRLNPHEQSA